jgi:hypothetical protein
MAEGSDGEAAGAGEALREDEGVLLAHFDAEDEVGVLELDLDVVDAGEDAVGDEAIEFGRGEGVGLVAALGSYTEGDGPIARHVFERLEDDSAPERSDLLGVV